MSSGYVAPIVTVDTVCLAADAGTLSVLLITRAAEPFAGQLALPGVYMQRGETIVEASDRCLADKAAVELPAGTPRPTIEVHDSIGRDPRGHSLSIVTAALTHTRFETSGAWAPVDELTALAFDHVAIIDGVRAWCRRNLWTDPLVFAGLLGSDVATTGQIADVVEAVHGRPMDTSNLRRRIAASEVFTPSEERIITGPGRPGAAWQIVPGGA